MIGRRRRRMVTMPPQDGQVFGRLMPVRHGEGSGRFGQELVRKLGPPRHVVVVVIVVVVVVVTTGWLLLLLLLSCRRRRRSSSQGGGKRL